MYPLGSFWIKIVIMSALTPSNPAQLDSVASTQAAAAIQPAEILIIGTASLDVLHLNLLNLPQVIRTIGGAGLYTALAAARAGARTTLFAPRPVHLPPELTQVEQYITWLGPVCETEALPKLEIVHHGGGKAELLGASWGAELRMTPADLPAALSRYRIIHIAALSSAQRQLDFLRACRERGAQHISAGTYARLAYGETANVRQLIAEADLFFMNDNEARGVYGALEDQAIEVPAGKTLFVTQGEHGALIFQVGGRTVIQAVPAIELDPTGAGDTFCGTTLAGLSRNWEATAAASEAVRWAARVIEQPGPAALL